MFAYHLNQTFSCYLQAIQLNSPWLNVQGEVVLVDSSRIKQLAPGIIYYQPSRLCEHNDSAVILSCGLHGDETAPIEILSLFLRELVSAKIKCIRPCVIIFANILAIQRGVRFIETNLNRLFALDNREHTYQTSFESVGNYETKRANLIKQQIEFLLKDKNSLIHLDLHASIQRSRYPLFAVMPYIEKTKARPEPSVANVISSVSLKVDAIIYSSQASNTFSYYTANKYAANAATVEVGSIRKFGENDDKLRNKLINHLQKLVVCRASRLSSDIIYSANYFKTSDVVVKDFNDFQFVLAKPIENFTAIKKGQVFAFDQVKQYIASQDGFICFANEEVEVGERALVIFEKMDFM
ncbi:succinylglutamate desuccinylase [Catenovulum sediminis]|uniref:Succinylglutamate desuccinylase n=1 Tax=Catenovulum sediminis TaxID=1740262 RepID=A0ABV1RLB6_9ALTE